MSTSLRLIFTLEFCSLLFLSCDQEISKREVLENLKTDVSYLASDELAGRETGTEGEENAADYLAERFKEVGLEPMGTDKFLQPFSVSKPSNPHEEAEIGLEESGINGSNVIGFLDKKADKTIVIGAHFDHLGMGESGSLHRGDAAIHNGADDNASGTAALIALAEIFKSKDLNSNLLFIGFSGEEQGLWGSNYFVKNPTIELASIRYMINMDMVGRLNQEKSLAISGVGTSPSFPVILDQINEDSLKLVTTESGVGPSDHTSFYLQDVAVLHFFTGQHEDYHKPTDDAEKINFEGIFSVVKYIERLVGELDREEEIAFTKTQDSSGDSPRFTVSLGVVPDYLFDGEGMRIDGVSEDRPAQIAGLQKGDVVIQLGDSSVVDMMSYMRALSSFEKGDSTSIRYKREDELLEAKLKF